MVPNINWSTGPKWPPNFPPTGKGGRITNKWVKQQVLGHDLALFWQSANFYPFKMAANILFGPLNPHVWHRQPKFLSTIKFAHGNCVAGSQYLPFQNGCQNFGPQPEQNSHNLLGHGPCLFFAAVHFCSILGVLAVIFTDFALTFTITSSWSIRAFFASL